MKLLSLYIRVAIPTKGESNKWRSSIPKAEESGRWEGFDLPENPTEMDPTFMEFPERELGEEAYPPNIPHARVRVIGDVHGYINHKGPGGYSYLDLIKTADHSIQVGDMGGGMGGGFDYSSLADVDAESHMQIAGNHDDYDNLAHTFLGDYGTQNVGGLEFFYIRGAFSPNKVQLQEKGHWWEQEEIPAEKHGGVLEAFVRAKPRVVISHDAPTQLLQFLINVVPREELEELSQLPLSEVRKLDRSTRKSIAFYKKWGVTGDPSPTNQLLERVWDAHQPQLWIFGHHHKNWTKRIRGTTFVCLGELAYMDFN